METDSARRRAVFLSIMLLAFTATACSRSKTMKGAEVSGIGLSCDQHQTKDKKFEHVSQ